MSSKRLPGKVLYSTNKGEEVLLSIYRRLEQSLFLDKIIILTSSENSDDPIQDLCKQEGLKCMRGPLENVYSRFSMALAEYPCSAFLRICADSPFVNIPMIDHAICNFFEKKECYYLSNTIKRTFFARSNFSEELFWANFPEPVDTDRLEYWRYSPLQ